jgi:SnoaL-like protein
VSQENVERLRVWHDEIARAIKEALDPEIAVFKMAELWHPEVEYDMTEAPWLDVGGVYKGIDAVRQLWRDWYGAWDAIPFHYALVDAGDRVVVLLDTRMGGRTTGIEVPWELAYVVGFREGLIAHAKLYTSQSEALEAAGLSE